MSALSDIDCSSGKPHPLPLTRRWVEDYKNHIAGQLSGACPDLQELVQRWGGYDRIPPEAWSEYDLALAEWRNMRRGALLIKIPIAA
jgi:hypothetical protein